MSSTVNHLTGGAHETEDGPVIAPLPGGEIDVLSDQPWDVAEMPAEEQPGFIAKLREYARLPITQNFDEPNGGPKAVLAREFSDDERGALWARLGMTVSEQPPAGRV